MIFTDKKRLVKLFSGLDRPIQIIFAGKAHLADQLGKELIKAI